ncbi:hypothetical protein A2975_00640 [Candidatus Woesebacteria bacterium RIFCSPLOWO2_01_FULL_44_14]|uniref:Uncharacterized protein n=1 Tax=Candidatus Woesebacteria bacterium RIFCSPLOWO2_01_FULL_44_14 TaxID=1802525 RepID=A0A1F8C004_9BACT|nr:MAG: hypothetical protein A2975_00640 [Candidatus Woesebacteria bacterium RIFCSPLOWO2_01_FULL_44_14]
MTEIIKHSAEFKKNNEQTATPEKDKVEHVEKEPIKTPEKQPLPNVETLREEIKHEAISAKELSPDETPENNVKESYLANKELKTEALRRSLRRVRKHLRAPDRALSKVVHQPVVDAFSKVGANTIARPSGILAGSIIALLGSSYLLYTAKHYGFSYNYLVIFLLFGGGWALGLILEFIIYGFRKIFVRK